jgi:hypothetical protein
MAGFKGIARIAFGEGLRSGAFHPCEAAQARVRAHTRACAHPRTLTRTRHARGTHTPRRSHDFLPSCFSAPAAASAASSARTVLYFGAVLPLWSGGTVLHCAVLWYCDTTVERCWCAPVNSRMNRRELGAWNESACVPHPRATQHVARSTACHLARFRHAACCTPRVCHVLLYAVRRVVRRVSWCACRFRTCAKVSRVWF